MELQKIRNLSDDELVHHEKTTADQLFRLRFQVAMGQNDGVKKLRQLRKEIAQVKTIARERELGIHGEVKEAETKAEGAPAAEKPKHAHKPAAARTRKTTRPRKAAAAKKTAKTKKAATAKKAAKTKKAARTKKAAGSKKTKGASK